MPNKNTSGKCSHAELASVLKDFKPLTFTNLEIRQTGDDKYEWLMLEQPHLALKKPSAKKTDAPTEKSPGKKSPGKKSPGKKSVDKKPKRKTK